MRPKIVLLTLVVATGLVALAAVCKGLFGKGGADAPAPALVDSGNPSSAAADGAGVKAGSSNNAALAEELRAAEIQKALEEINGAVIAGASDPASSSIVLEKVTHPEPEVRQAALQAVLSLNDTNAIPRLEEAQQMLENPREKVAVMDAIAFLKLPDTLPDTPVTNDLPRIDVSNFSRRKAIPGDPGGKGVPGSRAARRQKRQGQPDQQYPQTAAPGDASQAQPQPAAPAPDATPPQ